MKKLSLLFFMITVYTTVVYSQETQTKHSSQIKSAEKTTNNAISVNPESTGTNDLPSDFPKYINTGNSELDNKNYHDAKTAWYNSHPEEAKKFTGDNYNGKIIFSKEEFEALSPKRKEFVLAHPGLYTVNK